MIENNMTIEPGRLGLCWTSRAYVLRLKWPESVFWFVDDVQNVLQNLN